MTDLPERAVETDLEDLTDRSILTADLSAQTYFLPPLTAKFIRTHRPEAVAQTGDALTDRTFALAMQYGGATNYEGFKTLDAEWNLLAAALPRLLTGNYDRLQTVCKQLFQFLNFTGKWDDLLWLSEQAEVRTIADNDKESAGWNAVWTGFAYSLRNQPAEVLACAARAAKHWQGSTPGNKASVIQLRGRGYELQKDYSAAITAYREALEIIRSISPESGVVANIFNTLGGAERKNKDYPAAKRDFHAALRIAKITKHNEQIAIYTGNLTELALDRAELTEDEAPVLREAEGLAREALALAEKVGRQELIAGDCHRIAKALLKQNRDLEEALSLSRRAVEIFTRLRHPNLPEAQETLAEIEAQIKEHS